MSEHQHKYVKGYEIDRQALCAKVKATSPYNQTIDQLVRQIIRRFVNCEEYLYTAVVTLHDPTEGSANVLVLDHDDDLEALKARPLPDKPRPTIETMRDKEKVLKGPDVWEASYDHLSDSCQCTSCTSC